MCRDTDNRKHTHAHILTHIHTHIPLPRCCGEQKRAKDKTTFEESDPRFAALFNSTDFACVTEQRRARRGRKKKGGGREKRREWGLEKKQLKSLT